MAKKNFEAALHRLEQITEELESGDLSLDASLKKFDEGIQLVAFCNETLEEARSRIELLQSDPHGITVQPFDEAEEGQ